MNWHKYILPAICCFVVVFIAMLVMKSFLGMGFSWWLVAIPGTLGLVPAGFVAWIVWQSGGID